MSKAGCAVGEQICRKKLVSKGGALDTEQNSPAAQKKAIVEHGQRAIVKEQQRWSIMEWPQPPSPVPLWYLGGGGSRGGWVRRRCSSSLLVSHNSTLLAIKFSCPYFIPWAPFHSIFSPSSFGGEGSEIEVWWSSVSHQGEHISFLAKNISSVLGSEESKVKGFDQKKKDFFFW